MKCARCGIPLEVGYYGAYSREVRCEPCYRRQMNKIVREAMASDLHDDECQCAQCNPNSVATRGVTLDKVEPAVEEALE